MIQVGGSSEVGNWISIPENIYKAFTFFLK